MSKINKMLSDLILSMAQGINLFASELKYSNNLNLLLFRMGWIANIDSDQLQDINQRLGLENLFDDNEGFLDDLQNSTDDQNLLSLCQKIIALVPEIIDTINSIDNLNSSALPFPFTEIEFKQQCKNEFPDYIICNYLDFYHSDLYFILYAIGIINLVHQTPTGTYRVEYYKFEVDWNGLSSFISDPIKYIKETYKWGNTITGFDYNRFFKVVTMLCSKISIKFNPYPANEELKAKYFNTGNAVYEKLPMLEFPIILEDDFSSIVGFHLMPIPEENKPNGIPVGFFIAPFALGNVTGEIDLSDKLKLYLNGGFSVDSPGRYEIRPGGNKFVIDQGASSIDGKIGIGYKPTSPIYLIGSSESKTFLNIEGLYGAVGLNDALSIDPELIVEFGTSEDDSSDSPQLNLTIDLSEGDSFISKIFKNVKPINTNIGGKFIYSSKHGLSFSGQGGLKITIPLNKKIGPIDLRGLVLGLSIGKEPGIYAGLNAGANISVVKAEVSEIGVSLKLKDTTGTGKKGIIGNYDLEFGFKPPTGIGLRIEASILKGGGFLYIDSDAGKYGGALDLQLSKLSLAALGLICTKLPGGRKGYSLLVVISVGFSPGVNLIFGFTLNKVGGLVGLNREIEGDKIRDGVRDGSMTEVLFPEKPTEHAMEILSKLESYFPTSEKETFIIGPMLQIGWGTPTLITLDFMLLVQINPFDIAIAGLLRCMLPTADAAILRLNVAFFGELNPSKKFLMFDAAIFDSGILFLTLSGGIAVRLIWGKPGGFILSVGGFHPSYSIPQEMKLKVAPERLKITVIDESFIKLNIDAYFAVTSNTVQFGTHLNLYVNVASIIEVKGYLGFDALIYFKPHFSFITNIGAIVSVSIFGEELLGISLFFNLSGPKPWHAWGSGSIKLLFIKYSTNFDHTFGKKAPEIHEKIEVYKLFKEEIEKQSNWTVVDGTTSGMMVRFREIGTNEMILSPNSTLMISQRTVPLGVTIDKFGTKEVDGQSNFDISKVELFYEDSETAEIPTLVNTKDQFAPGEFFNLSTSSDIGAKSQSFLKAASFDDFKAGIIIKQRADSSLDFAYTRRKVLSPFLILIDSIPATNPSDPIFESPYHFEKSMWENSACQSPLSPYSSGSRPYTAATNVQVVPSNYVLVSTYDNSRYDPNSAFETQNEADQHLKDLIRAKTVNQGEYITMNLCEVN